jgi:hypothetical protein
MEKWVEIYRALRYIECIDCENCPKDKFLKCTEFFLKESPRIRDEVHERFKKFMEAE